jgi:putative transposase
MKKQRFNERQIISILKQYDSGSDPIDICREYGVSKAFLFNWRKKYTGNEASHINELKVLQEENRILKKMFSDLMLDHTLAKKNIKKSCNAMSEEYFSRPDHQTRVCECWQGLQGFITV